MCERLQTEVSGWHTPCYWHRPNSAYTELIWFSTSVSSPFLSSPFIILKFIVIHAALGPVHSLTSHCLYLFIFTFFPILGFQYLWGRHGRTPPARRSGRRRRWTTAFHVVSVQWCPRCYPLHMLTASVRISFPCLVNCRALFLMF